MTSKLTEEEREIWRQIYLVHEQFHDMPLTADNFCLLRDALVRANNACNAHPLMLQLSVALFQYFDAMFHMQTEQLKMEDAV